MEVRDKRDRKEVAQKGGGRGEAVPQRRHVCTASFLLSHSLSHTLTLVQRAAHTYTHIHTGIHTYTHAHSAGEHSNSILLSLVLTYSHFVTHFQSHSLILSHTQVVLHEEEKVDVREQRDRKVRDGIQKEDVNLDVRDIDFAIKKTVQRGNTLRLRTLRYAPALISPQHVTLSLSFLQPDIS